MDQATRDLLIVFLGAFIGLVTALLVARTSAEADRRLERDRWKRELFGEFMRLTDVMRGGSEAGSVQGREERLAARDRSLQIHFEIELIAPAMFEATAELWEPAKQMVELDYGLDPSPMATKEELVLSYLSSWVDFKTAAQRELGTAPTLRERLAMSISRRVTLWRYRGRDDL